MSRRWRAWLLFLACMFVYNANLRYTGSFDSLSSSELPFRILTGHGLTFEGPRGTTKPLTYSFFHTRENRWISFYPVLAPLAATPLYVPAVLLERSHPGLDRRAIEIAMEKLSASLFAALSVVILFLALSKITSERLAIWLAVAYAFGTSTWAISSQSFWPHGMGELLLASALFLLADRLDSPGRLALLGALAGLLVANRPTDALFSLALAVIVVGRHRAQAWPFFALAGAIAAVLIAYNVHEFGTLTGGYGTFQAPNGRPFGLNPIGVSGLIGLLFSNRGVFCFSPFLLIFFIRRWRGDEAIPGLKLLLVAYLGSLFLYGLSFDWMGGYCYGPRYAIHGLPVLIIALVEPLERISQFVLGRLAFVASAIFSIALQAIGAFFYPYGDSGNWHHGLWTIRNSSPMLALRAGPAMPAFLFLFVPNLATQSRLTPSESPCRLEWSPPPPERLRIGESVVLHLQVANLGSSHWSSIGGPFNTGGVRIHAVWRTEAEPGRVVTESEGWLAGRLDPGQAVDRDMSVEVPPAKGPIRLMVELIQDRIGALPSSSCAPLYANVFPY